MGFLKVGDELKQVVNADSKGRKSFRMFKVIRLTSKLAILDSGDRLINSPNVDSMQDTLFWFKVYGSKQNFMLLEYK
jgi:hypothetical protein